MIKKRFSLILLLALIISSCTTKYEGYTYVAFEKGWHYSYPLDYPFQIDSLYTYDTFFSCKFIPKEVKNDHLILKLTICDPSGVTYLDTISFPMHIMANSVSEKDGIEVFEQGKYTEIEWPYRSNVKSDKIGLWDINAQFISDPEGIYGLGFRFKGNNSKNNGKR